MSQFLHKLYIAYAYSFLEIFTFDTDRYYKEKIVSELHLSKDNIPVFKWEEYSLTWR